MLGEAVTSSGSGLAHAERLAFGDHDDAVVQEAVEKADGGGVLGQEPAPGLEGPVRADAEGAAFVGGGDEPEQRTSSGNCRRALSGSSRASRAGPGEEPLLDRIR